MVVWGICILILECKLYRVVDSGINLNKILILIESINTADYPQNKQMYNQNINIRKKKQT